MKNLIIAFSLISIFYQVIYAQSDTFLSNPPGKWTFPNNITYDYNNTLPNEFINAIDAAAQTWNNSQVGIQFAQQTNSGNQFKYADCGSGPDGFILAITTSTVSSGTVWLANTTITSNTNVTWNTGMEDAIFPSNDLESNILHELGHWLNLADNNTNTNAVMYKILSPGITKRDLTYYDTQPVYNLYLATGICNTCLPYPTHLTASIVGQNIILNWINPTYTNDCYELQVYKNGNFLGNVPSLTSTSYTDVNGVSTLPANYYISVLGNGTGKSSTINISVSPSIIGLNSTWKGVIYSNNNVTINSSVLLTVEPGTNIYFDSGKSLVVNGTLIADGGSNLNPITFNFISPNSTLNNGIVFSNGSSGIINYCQIRSADRGIYENNVSVNITNSAISNCTNGLYLYSSSPTLRWNNFHDNTNAGIYLISSSSPHLDSNYVRNNVYGVYCTTSSNPKFGNGSTHGLNDISGNSSYGVFCWNNSLPILGNNSPTDGGYNNLVNIATNAFNLYTLSSGTVYAINNWWGSTTNLRIAGPGGITFSPYLSSTAGDPKPPLSKSTNTFYASISCDIPFLDQLNKANEMIAENNLEQARKICLNLVTNYPDYSVSYNALNLIKDTYPASEINSSINTYTSLFNMKGKNNLYAMAGLILADIDKENKLNRIDDVINKYKKKSIVELALFDKFVFYYFEKQDRTNALAVSKELDEMFPLSQGAVEAHRILGDKEYYNIIPKQALQNTANQTPVEYALLGNYPNPFNPTTKINYSLPQDGEVLLKVFDTLGREVATLVNGFVNSGKHDVVWDGTNYASGIYFYSITFNGKTLNKKMLLMK